MQEFCYRIYYICTACARRMKWRWPNGHAATMHVGVCQKCGRTTDLASVDDWLKPGDKKLKNWD
jgi:hypothetical protein